MHLLVFFNSGITEMGSITHDLKAPIRSRIIGELRLAWQQIG